MTDAKQTTHGSPEHRWWHRRTRTIGWDRGGPPGASVGYVVVSWCGKCGHAWVESFGFLKDAP